MIKRVKYAACALLVASVCVLSPLPAEAARNMPDQEKRAKFSQKSILDEAYSSDDCRRLIGAAERRHRIPAQLLSAIALAESGRWMADRGAIIAWPWTVYAQGKGQFHASHADATAAVSGLKAQGVGNIDVGCMQVNLHYHGKAFADPGEALTPERNIDYAAGLLRRLYTKHRSWLVAVAHYHSATKALNVGYRKKVMTIWHKERRWAINERRRLVQAAYDRRRADRSYRKR
jgi:hypothetical protein